jgi:hypothetical protein
VWGSVQKGGARVQKPEGYRDEEYAMIPGDDMLISDDEDDVEDERNRSVVRTELQKDTT